MKGADPKITAKVLAGFDDHLRTYPGLKFGLVIGLALALGAAFARRKQR